MIAVVMAGGKASRFSRRVEKATLKIEGLTLLERSVNALREGGAGRILVAVTASTPKTKILASGLGVEPIPTGGEGYHEDVLQLLELHRTFLSLNVDVPFVNGQHVEAVASESAKGSVSAVVPFSLVMGSTDGDSVLQDPSGERMLWVGLNRVTPNPENHLKVLDDPLLTINVNDETDLAFARKVASERGL